MDPHVLLHAASRGVSMTSASSAVGAVYEPAWQRGPVRVQQVHVLCVLSRRVCWQTAGVRQRHPGTTRA